MEGTEELERHWAARVIQQTWKEYTERQWAAWQRLHGDDASLVTFTEGDAGAVSELCTSGGQVTARSDTPGELSDVDEALLAKLEADPKYQILAATESALDDQVAILRRQQEAVEMQHHQFQLRQLAKEKEEKQRRKLARLRAKELQKRRTEEQEKFHALETMHILRDVDFAKKTPSATKKPKPKPRPAPAVPPPEVMAQAVAAIPTMKIYPRLPNLSGTKSTPRGAPEEKNDVKVLKIDHTKTIAAYAQDLTPLVNGEKPRRVKVATVGTEKRPRKSRPEKSKLRVDNQNDDYGKYVEPPPSISIPIVSKKESKFGSMLSSAPLTAEIKHISWMTTLQKEIDKSLGYENPPLHLPTAISEFIPQSPLPASTLSPRTPVTAMDNEAALALAARREFLLSKYGKLPAPTKEPAKYAGEPESGKIAAVEVVAFNGTQASTDRLQSILNKYKIASATATDERGSITPSSTQSLLAKYVATGLVGNSRA
ncbi:hypothetical protein ACHHYP_20467 [Achlya hypogyna]|uniref:Uncharacterized protein n=1 Tax=Achlya hypogyna TaxID=1202772 RepID=A0A1V9YLQ1_ACHHY|nr:hypothetical protein ACHHYP_20467 [Achlya hypogyna]